MTEAATNGELSLLRAEVARLDQRRDAEAEHLDDLLQERDLRFDSATQHIAEIVSEREKRLDQRIDNQETAVTTALVNAEKAVQAALAASERAVDKAETTQGKTDAKLQDLGNLISAQTAALAELRSRIDIGSPNLAALQARSDEQEGRHSAGQDNQAILFAVAAGLIGIGGLVVALLR